MFFLNLSLPEFLALLGTFSGVAVALYLLDRARRRQTVASLRFFASAASAPEHAHRRHVQQPLSLLLQLLSMVLLLLALAQLRCGVPERSARQDVLILDTSAWMGSTATNGARLMDRARAAARAYLRSLPHTDRVMIVRADALATPVTGFTADRKQLVQAIDASQPGASVLNIGQALSFAVEAQKVQSGEGGSGEIVFVGAGRIDPETESDMPLPPNLRMIPVTSGAVENCGLRKVTVRRSQESADQWDIFISVKNYSGETKSVSLVTLFDGAPSGSRSLLLDPGSVQDAAFTQSTKAAGILDVRLSPLDRFPQDNHAMLELPAPVILPVTVYTDDPGSLQPLLEAIPAVQVTFRPVSQYSPAKTGARIVILDRFAPLNPPAVDAIWIAPPASRSPVPVVSGADHVKLTHWHSDLPLAAGIHSRDLDVDHTLVFRTGPEDIRVAESGAGPVIVARAGATKLVVLGFQPERSALRYQLVTPLLFANMLRWMAPQVFRSVEVSAGAAGSVSIDLSADARASANAIQVTDEKGRALPFTLDGSNLRFFSGAPGVARVIAGGQELVYSLTLPAAGDEWWNPRNVRMGVPGAARVQPEARDLWQLLALLGGAGLLADWLLYGVAWKRRRPSHEAGRRPALRKTA